jgi:hypothetical protein
MARPGFMAILMGGILLPTLALHPAKLRAQTPSATPPTTLSYDDLAAAEKQTAAQKEAAASKHGKKDKQTAPSSTPLPTAAAVTPAPAAPASAAASETQATSAVTDAAPTSADPAAPTADGTVPSAVAAEAGETADGSTPKIAPKMQRTMFGKMKPVKEKAPKLVPVTIVHGELTVDGLIAKAGLNFQIPDMRYFYIWVPGLGTTIVSNQPFPGSHIEESALDGSSLTVKVDGHQIQLACDRDMLSGKKPKPLSVFVALDKTYDRSSNYPEFGYGTVLKPPYNWPGTLADMHPNTKAPPLPANLRQNTESIKMCHKNDDGTQGACRTVDVPMVIGKTS